MRLFQQLKIVFIEVNHAGKTAIIIDNQNFLSQLLGIFYLSDQLSPDVIIPSGQKITAGFVTMITKHFYVAGCQQLMLLTLTIYTPSHYILSSKMDKYAELYGDNKSQCGFHAG